jgi:hypothetical protein
VPIRPSACRSRERCKACTESTSVHVHTETVFAGTAAGGGNGRGRENSHPLMVDGDTSNTREPAGVTKISHLHVPNRMPNTPHPHGNCLAAQQEVLGGSAESPDGGAHDKQQARQQHMHRDSVSSQTLASSPSPAHPHHGTKLSYCVHNLLLPRFHATPGVDPPERNRVSAMLGMQQQQPRRPPPLAEGGTKRKRRQRS